MPEAHARRTGGACSVPEDRREPADQSWPIELVLLPLKGHVRQAFETLSPDGSSHSITSSARARIDGGNVRPSTWPRAGFQALTHLNNLLVVGLNRNDGHKARMPQCRGRRSHCAAL